MSFCASCGRQRNENSRFCGGCGAEFSDSADAAGDQGSPAAEAPGRDMTYTDAAPEMTRIEPPTSQTDPFASWYQGQPQAVRNDAGSTWQPTQTALPAAPQAVHATPPQAGGYPSSGFSQADSFTPANPFSSANPVSPAGPPFPPAPPAGPPERGGMRGLFVALAVIVVLAAGGGAYALATTLGKHGTAQPTTSTSAGGSPTAGATQQASSPAAPTSAGPTPSPTLSLVSIAPGVTAGAAGPQVETLLSHYFRGINTHSYAEYASTLNPEELAKQPESEFNSGYSSTADSGMTLTGLSGNGSGLTATVTFTSRQSPAQSVDRSACNAWTLNLYLVPQGSGYLIGPAPSGYQPTYSDC
jgi:hypothetical protein